MTFGSCVDECANFLDVAWEFLKTPIQYSDLSISFHGILICFFILSIVLTFFSLILKGGVS